MPVLRRKSTCTELCLGFMDIRRPTDFCVWRSIRAVTSMLYLCAKCGMAVDDNISATTESTGDSYLDLSLLFRRHDGTGPQCFIYNAVTYTYNLRCGHLSISNYWSIVLFSTCELNLLHCLCALAVFWWGRDGIKVLMILVWKTIFSLYTRTTTES